MRPLDALEMILRELGMEERHDLWIVQWEESYEAFPGEPLPILDRTYVEAQVRAIGLDLDFRHALVEGIGLFSRQPALKRLLWHVYFRLFVRKVTAYPRWPDLPDELDEAAPLFYGYVFLLQVPKLLALHRQRKIDPAVTRATLQDLQLWMQDFQNQKGVVGLSSGQVSWLALHFEGSLFHLERLQFEFATFKYPYLAFRRRSDGSISAFSSPENPLNGAGLPGAASVGEDLQQRAESFTMGKGPFTGYPIGPLGRTTSTPALLSRKEWEVALKPGDPTIAVHIPATGPMDFDACGQSFLAARTFFARHFPAYHAKAYTCSSWLLDPQLEAYTNPSGNIARFLGEWYLLPYPNATEREALRRVFGVTERPENLATLSQRTSLQRDMVAFLRSGGTPGAGLGLQFPDTMAWGKQVYRSLWEQCSPV